MCARELMRQRRNSKVISFSKKVLSECEKENFTIADVKDLVNILPSMINEALITIDENEKFILFQAHQGFQNNNDDIHPQNSDTDQ